MRPTVWLSPDWCCVLHQIVACQVYLLQPRQCGQHIDADNQGVSNGNSLYRTQSNSLFPARDYLPVHQCVQELLEIILWQDESGLRFETRLLSASCSTANGDDHWATWTGQQNDLRIKEFI